MRRLHLTASVALSLACMAGLGADPFADAVVDFAPGLNAGFGQSFLPGNVLGRPEGGESANSPQFSQDQLVSLGDGGSITLAFLDNAAFDGPGPDLIVFENVLLAAGTGDPFIEAAVVEVSIDGADWRRFPFDFVPPDPPSSLIRDESHFPIGFAGVHPTLTNSTNGVDPLDPMVAGGDAFDLADVGLPFARFVRIVDSQGLTDGDGDPVVDDGDLLPFTPAATAGFDLDAVAAVHATVPSPVAGWGLYR